MTASTSSVGPSITPRIEQIVTSGKFCLDGGEWDVDNNVYLLVYPGGQKEDRGEGQRESVVLIDPAHEPDTIRTQVGQRKVRAILLTHAHNDHCELAPALAKEYGVPVYLHPDDDMLWRESNGDAPYVEIDVEDPSWEREWGIELRHTPGHTPGCIVIQVKGAHVLLSGDTLFAGGPGATGRKYSDFDMIIESLRDKVFSLPADIEVRPGHGDFTTIGAEAARLDEYIERGY